MMGASVTWTANSITVTRAPGTKLKGIDVDCGAIPDAAMTLAIVALFAEGPTAIRNVYNWCVHARDRKMPVGAVHRVGRSRPVFRSLTRGHAWAHSFSPNVF